VLEKSPLQIEIDAPSTTAIRVALHGDLDFHTAGELTALDLPEGAEQVELDLAGVDFIDSSGLAALVRFRQRAEASGAALRVVAVTPYLRSLMRMTALDRLFDLPPA
jgi:anti-sigma B factor antagonist